MTWITVASRAAGWLDPCDAESRVDPGRVKSSDQDLLQFIASSFRSVWALELLLLLKRENRPWGQGELVAAMRASDLVVSKAIASLLAAGLASSEEDGVFYLPVSEEVAGLVERTETLYAARPDAVRRAIVSASVGGLTAFADAFRLRKD